MWQFWLIVAGICFVIESFTVGFLVFWFGVGALAALVTDLFITDSMIVQSIIFIITSTILLIFTKPFVKKFIKANETVTTNVYSIIGKEGIVLEKIDNVNSTGKVKVNGELWSAFSDTNIEKDEKIKVVSIEGVKLKVEKLPVSNKMV